MTGQPEYEAECADVMAYFETVRPRQNFDNRAQTNNLLIAGENRVACTGPDDSGDDFVTSLLLSCNPLVSSGAYRLRKPTIQAKEGLCVES